MERLESRTRFRRAYLSFNHLEWWYGHLASALARRLEVIQRPMAGPSQPGHAIDAAATALVDGESDNAAFYLGSVDQLFPRLAHLPLPTAVWADWIDSSAVCVKRQPCLNLFDVVFSTQKDAVPVLKAAGNARVEWLPFACDTSLASDPGAAKRYDVGFVGSLDLPATRDERRETLALLARRFHLNDYRIPVFRDDMMRVYNQSRIAVNIPVPGGFNMRVFEALASGALLVTKAVANGQDDLFKDGVHLVTYRNQRDLIDKIDYYLRHDREREEIAAAGRREVSEKHTYDRRASRLLEVMSDAPRTRATKRSSEVAAYAAFWDAAGRPDLLRRLALEPDVSIAARVGLLLRAAAKGAKKVARSSAVRRSR
jgi:glycosyltransferase involved in cell wall biosynthesis